MHPLREWLFKTVATELCLKEYKDIHVKQLASVGGVNFDQVREYFPDKRALIFGLIDEISEAQKDFLLQNFQPADTASERLIQFIVNSLEFSLKYANLAEVFVFALLVNDNDIKEHVHDAYKKELGIILKDLIGEKIIPDSSPVIISDVTSILLSMLFLGSCPWLEMDYYGFVDHRRMAISTLSAMKKRYKIDREWLI